MASTIAFTVDPALCTRCGACVRDCPSHIIVLEAGGAPPRICDGGEGNCLECQHCLAVCPSAAVSILGRRPGDSQALTRKALPSLKQMESLVRGRRSVRQYKPEDVDPALVRGLLATLAHTPTGCNAMELSFTAIATRTALDAFRAKAFAALEAAVAAGRVPEKATFLHRALEVRAQHGVDIIFRGAPHVLIVSGAPDAACPATDVTIAAATFDLLAAAAGLGTVWCGMLKMLFEAVPELKAEVGLPAGHPYEVVLFGVPAVRYRRTVQRDDAARVKLIGA